MQYVGSLCSRICIIAGSHEGKLSFDVIYFLGINFGRGPGHWPPSRGEAPPISRALAETPTTVEFTCENFYFFQC
jgi:hypothetical protein